jgi:putative tricarboxylic transport membrane protein
MRLTELITGLVVASVGAYALDLALKMSMYGVGGIPGPGFFPRLLSGLLLGLGLLLAAVAVRSRPAPSPGRLSRGEEGRRELRAGTVWLCYAACVPLLTLLGFVPTMALLVFALVFGFEKRRTWRGLAVAIVVPVAISAVFVNLLTIPLPEGLISHGPFGI